MTDEERLQQLQDKKRLAELQAKKNASEDEGVNYSKLFLGVDDIEDFDAGDALKNMGVNFFDQADTAARFINRGVTLNYSDKLYSAVEALATDASYDEALERNRSRNKELKEKNPNLAVGSELAGNLLGIGKLVNAGVTATKAIPKTLKGLKGYAATTAAGGVDAAVISGLMAAGDDKNPYNAAATGAAWGTVFSALPAPAKALFKTAIAKKIGNSAKDMYDKAGNFIAPNLAKGDHEFIKTLYKQYVGEGLLAGPLLKQQAAQVKTVEDRLANVIAKTGVADDRAMALNTAATRRAKKADDSTKNTATDVIANMSAANKAKILKQQEDDIRRITTENNANLTAAEIEVKNANIATQNKILNEAAPTPKIKTEKVGAEAIDELAEAYKNSYNDAWKTAKPLSAKTKKEFAVKIKELKDTLTLDADKKALQNILNNFENIGANGGTAALRTFDSTLRKSSYSAGTKGETQLRDALLALRSVFTNGLPKNTQTALAALNKQYPKYKTVADASNTAIKTKGVFTPDQLLNSARKVGSGTAARGKAPLQSQGIDMLATTAAGSDRLLKLSTANQNRLSTVSDDAAQRIAENAAKAKAASTNVGRQITARNKQNVLDRADVTKEMKTANALRKRNRTSPFYEELGRLNLDRSAQNLKFPTKAATSAGLGAFPALALGSVGLTIPFGVTASRILQKPAVQQAVYGHHPYQKFLRDNLTPSLLAQSLRQRGVDKSLIPTLSASLSNKEEEEQQPRRRRRN
tara:strand:+ start:1198 stop:3456 length:2259 start_codon:yes stop_codon:yes gene_type:complete